MPELCYIRRLILFQIRRETMIAQQSSLCPCLSVESVSQRRIAWQWRHSVHSSYRQCVGGIYAAALWRHKHLLANCCVCHNTAVKIHYLWTMAQT